MNALNQILTHKIKNRFQIGLTKINFYFIIGCLSFLLEKEGPLFNCIYILNEGDNLNEIFEHLTTLVKKRIKFKKELNEKHKNLNPDFEQNYFSRTAKGN